MYQAKAIIQVTKTNLALAHNSRLQRKSITMASGAVVEKMFFVCLTLEVPLIHKMPH